MRVSGVNESFLLFHLHFPFLQFTQPFFLFTKKILTQLKCLKNVQVQLSHSTKYWHLHLTQSLCYNKPSQLSSPICFSAIDAWILFCLFPSLTELIPQLYFYCLQVWSPGHQYHQLTLNSKTAQHAIPFMSLTLLKLVFMYWLQHQYIKKI